MSSKSVKKKSVEPLPAAEKPVPPEPSAIPQPFPWMETPPQPRLPEALRRMQVEKEWDQAY
jgi:hypothetical protein